MSLLNLGSYQGGIALPGLAVSMRARAARGANNSLAKAENIQALISDVEAGVATAAGSGSKKSSGSTAGTPGSGGAGAAYSASPNTGSLAGGSQSFDPASFNLNATGPENAAMAETLTSGAGSFDPASFNSNVMATPGPISAVDHNTAPVVGAFLKGQFQGAN